MMFIEACYRRPTPRPPVWMMRQAGRYLPEYREIRSKYGFLEMCENPEIVKEVTLQPIQRFNLDAAIIFADILLPLRPMGLNLRFAHGEGPVIDNPIQTRADVDRLVNPEMTHDLGFLADALRLTRAALPADKALLGFAGAPFTLACYAVNGEGGNFDMVRRWMFTEMEAFEALMGRLSDMTIAYLRMQVAAGANAVQLFDSWGGQLSAYDYLNRVFPYIRRIMEGTADLGVPRILFVKNGGHLRDFLPLSGAEVIGLDWTMPIQESRQIMGDGVALQGNLDPMVLFANPAYIRQRTRAMLELHEGKPGYIANLGHGIHKDTPISGVRAFIETIKHYPDHP